MSMINFMITFLYDIKFDTLIERYRKAFNAEVIPPRLLLLLLASPPPFFLPFFSSSAVLPSLRPAITEQLRLLSVIQSSCLDLLHNQLQTCTTTSEMVYFRFISCFCLPSLLFHYIQMPIQIAYIHIHNYYIFIIYYIFNTIIKEK